MEFFRRSKKNEQAPIKILPEDVRYALQYGKGLLNKDEIEILNRNHFENEAFYLTVKGLQGSPKKQKELLEKYTIYEFSKKEEHKENKTRLQNLINEYIKELGDSLVKGGKLAQLSRQGFDFWQERFENKAKELSKDKRNVFLVANAMMLGLGHFIREFKKENKSFNIIMPEWMRQDAGTIGYSIDFEKEKVIVNFLKKNYDKKDALTVLVDDATNSGNVFRKIKEYWEKSGLKEPDTIAISKLSGK